MASLPPFYVIAAPQNNTVRACVCACACGARCMCTDCLHEHVRAQALRRVEMRSAVSRPGFVFATNTVEPCLRARQAECSTQHPSAPPPSSLAAHLVFLIGQSWLTEPSWQSGRDWRLCGRHIRAAERPDSGNKKTKQNHGGVLRSDTD